MDKLLSVDSIKISWWKNMRLKVSVWLLIRDARWTIYKVKTILINWIQFSFRCAFALMPCQCQIQDVKLEVRQFDNPTTLCVTRGPSASHLCQARYLAYRHSATHTLIRTRRHTLIEREEHSSSTEMPSHWQKLFLSPQPAFHPIMYDCVEKHVPIQQKHPLYSILFHMDIIHAGYPNMFLFILVKY